MGEVDRGNVSQGTRLPSEALAGLITHAYRRGDPLRLIAAKHGVGLEAFCSRLARKIVDKDELTRMRSTRARTAAAMAVLDKESHLIGRLVESGFTLVDIPKVLSALAASTEIDTGIVAELLLYPGPQDSRVCFDMPAPETPRMSDRLGLLYVIGKHHRIEPDYQLTLGQMPADEVAELRLLFTEDFPPRRFAEILGVVETTKLAVRARVATALSVTDYDAMAAPLSGRLSGFISDDSKRWPPPASTLARRLGDGLWDQAQRTVGLKLRKAADRFGEDDFPAAILDYAEECSSFDFPFSLETYDRWVIAETARGVSRPSALELIGRYGSWDAALREVQEPDSGPHGKPHVALVPDSYEPLFEPTDPSHEAAWTRAGEYVCELLARLPRRRSLLIEYPEAGTGTFRPYARAGRTAEGIWCEFSPGQFQAEGADPRDSEHLRHEGWADPDAVSPHWRKQEMPFHDSGHQILDALRYGWQCLDPWKLRWSTRQPINGQGRTRGVTIEDALAGDVQSLRNAG